MKILLHIPQVHEINSFKIIFTSTTAFREREREESESESDKDTHTLTEIHRQIRQRWFLRMTIKNFTCMLLIKFKMQLY